MALPAGYLCLGAQDMKANFTPKPPQAALDYFRDKALTPSFHHLDVYKEEHGIAFAVAKATALDILEVIHNAVDQALAEGRTLAQFKKELTPVLQQLGWWGKSEVADPVTGETVNAQLGSPRRLKVIYRTNLRTARASGQWDRIQRSQQTHPYLLYQLGPSENHREQHQSWEGLLLKADDPFWATHFPPNGWGCKCRVRQVSKIEHQRLVGTSRYQTKAPKSEQVRWTNKRTGEIKDVEKGIDPGWDHNPGQARKKHLDALVKEKQAAAKKRL